MSNHTLSPAIFISPLSQPVSLAKVLEQVR